MIILAVLLKSFNKTGKDIKTGLIIYNIGLLASILMMVVRGVLQIVSKTPVSSGIDSMISGLSGISHITLAVGLVMILFKFRNLDNDIEGE